MNKPNLKNYTTRVGAEDTAEVDPENWTAG